MKQSVHFMNAMPGNDKILPPCRIDVEGLNNAKEVLIYMNFQRKDAKNAKVAKKTDE